MGAREEVVGGRLRRWFNAREKVGAGVGRRVVFLSSEWMRKVDSQLQIYNNSTALPLEVIQTPKLTLYGSGLSFSQRPNRLLIITLLLFTIIIIIITTIHRLILGAVLLLRHFSRSGSCYRQLDAAFAFDCFRRGGRRSCRLFGRCWALLENRFGRHLVAVRRCSEVKREGQR